MAFRSSIVPEVAVYFVWPAFSASMAACLMKSGVSKSGSPAPNPTTSMPCAFISLARVVTAIVADGGTACARLLTFIPRCPFLLFDTSQHIIALAYVHKCISGLFNQYRFGRSREMMIERLTARSSARDAPQG